MSLESQDYTQIIQQLRGKAVSLGFADFEVTHFDSLVGASSLLNDWVAKGNHGTMHYMERHAALRANPKLILNEAKCAFIVRMNYLTDPEHQTAQAIARNHNPTAAQISLYAQGRDYHKVIRKRLALLAEYAHTLFPEHQFRAFTDSAPVMEVELAQASGLGWRGKHTLLLNREGGSYFFLGGILSTLALPASPSTSAHCGQCTACIDICPTQAITAPYHVDARRCISYLTIEHQGIIDKALIPLIGNKIYGCDDCQTVCPWNKFAQKAELNDFLPRNGLDTARLLDLWAWTELEFRTHTQGSAIARIGYERWLRNLSIAMGNALRHKDCSKHLKTQIKAALQLHLHSQYHSVREHIKYALDCVDSFTAN